MRRLCTAALCLGLPLVAFAEVKTLKEGRNEYLAEVVSEVYNTPEDSNLTSPSEIATKGRVCMLKTLKLTAVKMEDKAAGGLFSGKAQRNIIDAPAELIIAFDPDNGMVAGNSGIDYRHMMMGSNARSIVTLEAREGRFRITHGSITSIQKNSGTWTNSGFTKVGMWRGGGSKPVVKALERVTNQLAECINEPKAVDDW